MELELHNLYRAYIIGLDGHIELRIDLAAPDEETAREKAEHFVQGHAVELWLGDRKIATFEPTG